MSVRIWGTLLYRVVWYLELSLKRFLCSTLWVEYIPSGFKDFFINTGWLRPVFLFPTTLKPDIDFWLTNRFEVLGAALLLLLLGCLLLRSPEGLLKGSSEE